jgi:hypothetical protein
MQARTVHLANQGGLAEAVAAVSAPATAATFAALTTASALAAGKEGSVVAAVGELPAAPVEVARSRSS